MAKIRRSDKLQFINRFNPGTKREFVGKAIDLIGEPQAWEAVVLPLNYARKSGFSDLWLHFGCSIIHKVFGECNPSMVSRRGLCCATGMTRTLFRRLDACMALAVAASQVSYTDRCASGRAPSGWQVRMETHAVGVNYRLHAGNVLPKL